MTGWLDAILATSIRGGLVAILRFGHIFARIAITRDLSLITTGHTLGMFGDDVQYVEVMTSGERGISSMMMKNLYAKIVITEC